MRARRGATASAVTALRSHRTCTSGHIAHYKMAGHLRALTIKKIWQIRSRQRFYWGAIRDITALLHIHEFFFVSESGTGCRIDDFQQLKKLYSFGALVAEIQKVFVFAKQSEDRRELLLLPRPGLHISLCISLLRVELP
jgi:hypothetical protein